MFAYIVRRLLLMVPTVLGIMVINFFIINMAPGGPIDRIILEMKGSSAIGERTGAAEGREVRGSTPVPGQESRSSRGLEKELRDRLAKQLGLDRPLGERFLLMLRNYVTFDFGESFFKGRPVVDLIVERMPVSISLGLWTTLLTYLLCIPLGIAKARHDGSRFDVWTSGAIIIGYAIPSFLFGLLLIIVFATGTVVRWFPLRGLVSDDFASLSTLGQIGDYFWHMALPVTAMTIGGFATLTLLTKNSFLEEIRKQYVVTARAKGLTEGRVLYGHVFRNAMLLVIAGFPAAFVSILFTGALLIEQMFSLEGLGLLGFDAAVGRDYPVLFATLYVFSLIGLITHLISDVTYVLIDPRIDFEARAA
ncbi:MAG: microcin C ABC transporter permease YejB [Rhodospirillaceae bacterium]|nr:microcin C ABC transporter permease YejB [Rhodospirillaceae bacterium]